MRITLSLAMLCVVTLSGSAQSTKSPQQSAQTNSQNSAEKDKKLTPPPGKLRGTTNEMRMAAAARTADRKAQAELKKSSAPQTQGEVKQ
jgi:hypothetical protein